MSKNGCCQLIQVIRRRIKQTGKTVNKRRSIVPKWTIFIKANCNFNTLDCRQIMSSWHGGLRRRADMQESPLLFRTAANFN